MLSHCSMSSIRLGEVLTRMGEDDAWRCMRSSGWCSTCIHSEYNKRSEEASRAAILVEVCMHPMSIYAFVLSAVRRGAYIKRGSADGASLSSDKARHLYLVVINNREYERITPVQKEITAEVN